MDKSNGYENVAANFIEVRGQSADGIGTSHVREWACTLPPRASVLDLGCGTGIPISKIFVDEGMTVYGVDASPTLVSSFRQNFPSAFSECESVEDSSFFNCTFDGVIAWGLMFLLPEERQVALIEKVGGVLHSGGRLLFTAPFEKTSWIDILTGQRSWSLGAERYKALLEKAGFELKGGFEDEGSNYYYSAIKI